VLTISEVAGYAGVTVRAVRHYHQRGLLSEPPRDSSGYRRYAAGDVVRLIRIRTLAEAGAPLARVQELLDATPAEFGQAVAQIDAELRTKIRELQEHRRRIARLAAGDTLAVPPEVVAYLDKLRATGASDAIVVAERDAWILVAGRWPEKIPEFMADKIEQLDDPRLVRLYRMIGELTEGEVTDDQLVAVVDLLSEMVEESAHNGELDQQSVDMNDDAFVSLLDSFAVDSHPIIERLQKLMVERGWTGWTRMERAVEPG
jgi:DNA-binding transcriptional MerR regulator